MSSTSRIENRRQRHKRIRKKVSGTGSRPRMAIMKSDRQMYVQLIDDEQAVTLASASTVGSGMALNNEAAKNLGKRVAEAAMEKGIKSVVIDRGGYRFHGRVKALVDSAVESGLVITSQPGGDEAEEKEES